MAARIVSIRFADMVEAIEHIRIVLVDVSLEDFEKDWQRRWLVERGLEIMSEASRHIPNETKEQHPDIPWVKVAGIGNVLCHAYDRIAPDVLWKVAQDDLLRLLAVCREEYQAALARES